MSLRTRHCHETQTFRVHNTSHMWQICPSAQGQYTQKQSPLEKGDSSEMTDKDCEPPVHAPQKWLVVSLGESTISDWKKSASISRKGENIQEKLGYRKYQVEL